MENAASEIIMPIGVIATVTISVRVFINYMVRVNKKWIVKWGKQSLKAIKYSTIKR